MKYLKFATLSLFVLFGCNEPKQTEALKSEETVSYYKPWEDLGPIFHDVQTAGVFEDSKTFVDCTPNSEPEKLISMYQEFKGQKDFSLEDFVSQNFEMPASPKTGTTQEGQAFFSHLNNHWDYLTREGQTNVPVSTLIPLPNQYVVPGGRFREIYYWDSYFTMIGLGVSGRTDLIASMLDNFSHLVETVGYIPNGNRTYFLGRSQPPFFGSMIYLYAQLTDKQSALPYLESLQKEYDFWMDGIAQVTEEAPAYRRVVKVGDYILNRYYDDVHEPRAESYREDLELAEGLTPEQKQRLFLDLRAACESGWDFSARWFAEGNDFQSIRTSEIIPVDLNSILYHTEFVLSELYMEAGNQQKSQEYLKKAEQRYQAINEIFWNSSAQMYMDFLWTEKAHTGRVTAASFYPQYFKVAQRNFAEAQTQVLLDSLLDDGGIMTSPYASGQQWDAPNGWAPLQWVAIKGLSHYGFEEEASDISRRWLRVNQKVYASTEKMMEKYNVSDTTLLAGGGEYPTQDGFGWTNGVALGLSDADAKY